MKKHILLDIEALGTRPGSAIIELGAVEFFPDAGTLGRSFEAMIEPQAPFTADLETLAWHRKKGTWPRPFAEGSHAIGSALVKFEDWLADGGEVEAFWAWGATYDFPLLTAAYDFTGTPQPWQYWQQRCARSAWQLAFGDRRPDPRPHRAVEDAKAAAVDLMAAIKVLRGEYEAATVRSHGDGTIELVNVPPVSLIADEMLRTLVSASNAAVLAAKERGEA
jgi:DNA polymerase III epsilon subunit-like protein